ncbi:MAG: hypothetical protein KAS69_01780 [Planctomycetes bacterium]|nr:hypothetical protein [Planctomycetota bacterium]
MENIHRNTPCELAETKNDYRRRVEILKSRIDLLAGEDKVLMTMYLKNGCSFRQMAKLAHISEANMARKLHKIAERLAGNEYIALLKSRSEFSKKELSIAKDHFMLGKSMKKIAGKNNTTYYGIRETLKKIQKFINENNDEAEQAESPCEMAAL